MINSAKVNFENKESYRIEHLYRLFYLCNLLIIQIRLKRKFLVQYRNNLEVLSILDWILKGNVFKKRDCIRSMFC